MGKVRQKLRALDIMPRDMTDLWEILDAGDDDGELDADEFINGIRRLRGEARAKDVLRLQRELLILEGSVGDIQHHMETSMDRINTVKSQLTVARTDIAAVTRTISRAKDSVKLAAKTQSLR